MEKYLKLGTFFGLFPSMWSKYYAAEPDQWSGTIYGEDAPGVIRRDLDLHKFYIPLIQRIISAGWEPVTYAYTSNPAVRIERYGTLQNPFGLYWTIYNFSQKVIDVQITLQTQFLQLPENILIQELCTSETVSYEQTTGTLSSVFTIDADDIRVLYVSR